MENKIINNIKIVETRKGFPLIIPNNDCSVELLEQFITNTLKRGDIVSPAILIDKEIHKHNKDMLRKNNFTLNDEEYIVESNLKKLKETEQKIEQELLFISYSQCGLSPFLEVTNHSSGIERLKTEEGLKSLQDNNFNPDLWQVIYSEGIPVGMILCKIESNEVGRISFIAVIDDFRKIGLGTFLHKKALFILKENGATIYRGGTSRKNEPMLKIFKKNDCNIVSTMYLYIRQ